MGNILKRGRIVIVVLVLLMPVAIGITLYMTPLWLWFELNYRIESLGHSGPAEWCFVAVYGLLVFVCLATLVLLRLTDGKCEKTS
jgi:hypothetical protein